ncbi:hypothetical protein KI387_010987, partial [Taxus chinensis]
LKTREAFWNATTIWTGRRGYTTAAPHRAAVMDRSLKAGGRAGAVTKRPCSGRR